MVKLGDIPALREFKVVTTPSCSLLWMVNDELRGWANRPRNNKLSQMLHQSDGSPRHPPPVACDTPIDPRLLSSRRGFFVSGLQGAAEQPGSLRHPVGAVP